MQDKKKEAEKVFGADDSAHPAVSYLHKNAGAYYLGGPLQGAQLPVHYDYNNLRLSPAETRQSFQRNGWTRVCAFQTRNPMHRSHVELTIRAARDAQANLLVRAMGERGAAAHMRTR